MIKTKLLVPAVALFALAGCQTNGDMYRSDVYGSNQVNQAQQVQTVEIIAIQPARVAVNNQSDRNDGRYCTRRHSRCRDRQSGDTS